MRESLATPALPYELLWNVASYLMSCASIDLTGQEEEPNSFNKPPWTNIGGFSGVSKALRTIAMRNWFRSLHVQSEGDWELFEEWFAFVFKYTTSVLWHGCDDKPPGMPLASKYLKRFANLRSIRLIMLTRPDPFGYLEYRPLVLKAMPRSIYELEIYNDCYPGPELMRLIGESFPELCVLRMRQPAVWCSSCFTCSIPRFSRPFPQRTQVYTDGTGLPAFYASGLASLQKLHTIVITVGYMRGVRPFDVQNAYCWSGECEICLLMMDNDAVFRETRLERKKNMVAVPPNLTKAEWHFQPMSAFDGDWTMYG